MVAIRGDRITSTLATELLATNSARRPVSANPLFRRVLPSRANFSLISLADQEILTFGDNCFKDDIQASKRSVLASHDQKAPQPRGKLNTKTHSEMARRAQPGGAPRPVWPNLAPVTPKPSRGTPPPPPRSPVDRRASSTPYGVALLPRFAIAAREGRRGGAFPPLRVSAGEGAMRSMVGVWR